MPTGKEQLNEYQSGQQPGAEVSAKAVSFSVIIPTYNRAHLIIETLESVFAQTYPHYEIIVIDNCSTDNTTEVLRSYIDTGRIRYIRNEKNYERSYSRNAGMEAARNDFATLLDSDDFMYADGLADAASFHKNNPSLKVFHNKFEMVNDRREVVYRVPFAPLRNQYKALCSGNFLSAIGAYMHRDVYKEFRFSLDPQMIGSEDYLFWFQVLARYKVGRINKVNSGVREHPQRSVHVDAYSNLDYQCGQIIRTIREDKVLNEKFGKYTGRLMASFRLQDIISHAATYSRSKRLSLLRSALKSDFSILFTRRFASTLLNVFRK